MTDLEILQLLVKAKELGISQMEIAGYRAQAETEKNVPRETPSLSEKAEEIVSPMSVFEDMDSELVQYWATPYYDELIAKRELAAKRAKGEIE